jgi:FMN-dependent NADH-azoreductase
MTKILHIDSGIFHANSQSSQLSAHFLAAYQAKHGATVVSHRNLAAEPLPHLDAAIVAGFMTPEADRSPEQNTSTAISDTAIAELQAADVLVLGLPIYNFGVPSALKAWIDHVARVGITFRYTENGPEGLLSGKKAYVLAARGGVYAGTGNDHQTPYIRQVLGFLGITDVTFVYAEGLNMGDEPKAAALAAARAEIEAVVAAGEQQLAA